MARLNHSCDADVFSWIQQDSRNVMIVSSRPIKTGQEIQICYKSFHECLGQDFKSPESVTMMISLYLKCNWLIVCPPDCICKDKSIPSLINTFGRLQKMAYEAGSEGHFMRCLMYLEKLLELISSQPVMKGKVSNKISLIHDAMCASAMINGKENETMRYIKENLLIFGQIEQPSSATIRQYRSFEKNPEKLKEIENIITERFASVFHNL